MARKRAWSASAIWVGRGRVSWAAAVAGRRAQKSKAAVVRLGRMSVAFVRSIHGHPGNAQPGSRKGFVLAGEDLSRVAMEGEPALQVLGIPAVLLEAERAVVPCEDVDATVIGFIAAGGNDSACHGRLPGI